MTVAGPTRVFGDAALAPTAASSGRAATAGSSSAARPDLLCAVDAPGGLLIGTEGAHLTRVAPTGSSASRASRTRPGATTWYTPWGGPPETRSLARTDDNVLLASVHVGGIPRSDDGGRTWLPTIDIEADVHQVRALPGRAEVVARRRGRRLLPLGRQRAHLAGLAEGLHATYCRAVAVAGDAVIIERVGGSARPDRARSTGARSTGTGPFERVTDWIAGNVDTHALDALGDQVVYGTRAGTVWQSLDAGTTWDRLADDLAPVTSLSLVP